MRLKVILLLCLIKSIHAAANEKCYPSKKYIDDYEPLVFNRTNNLIGSYELLDTQTSDVFDCSMRIVVKARVLNQNCQPVKNALIYIWQPWCNGKYTYKPLRTGINEKYIDIAKKNLFLGSGVTTTNNEGEFSFITIYPASLYANYINVRVEPSSVLMFEENYFEQFQTRLFFKYETNSSFCYHKTLMGLAEYKFDIVVD